MVSEKELADKLYKEYIAKRKKQLGIVSKEYIEFVRKKKVKLQLWEQLSILSHKILKLKSPKDYERETSPLLDELNSPITPSQVYSAAILSPIILFPISFLFLKLSILYVLIFMMFAAYSFFYFKNAPKRALKIRRSKAGSELILGILYIVIQMRNTSNLEGAIRFAADNLTGPLGEDFKKMLWDVETKKYVSIQQALDNYVMKWKGINDSFVDAIYLIETSMVQRSESRRINMLDKALERVLTGTHSIMIKYTNALRTPVRAVFMLGITLPILSMVMLPLIAVFLSNLITPAVLITFYDILLPALVLYLVFQILATRPTAFPPIDLSNHPDLPKPYHFRIFRQEMSAIWPSLIIPLIFIIPGILYRPGVQPSENDVLFSMILSFGVALIPILFSHFSTVKRMVIRNGVIELEREFSYVTFQLSNRLAEGFPAEVAMMKTAKLMKGAKISKFVEIINWNITRVGLPLKDAIFSEKYGAIRMFPSSLVRAVMSVLVESVKRSGRVAAVALASVSEYLTKVNEIKEKIMDVLSDTVSTLKFQTTFVAPVIAGIIVGLTGMIMIILSVLSSKVQYLYQTSASVSSVPMGMFGLGFFNMSQAIPLFTFSAVVGFYIVEFTLISIYLESKIENGDDILALMNQIKKVLLISMLIFVVVSIGTAYAFGGLGRIAVGLGEFL